MVTRKAKGSNSKKKFSYWDIFYTVLLFIYIVTVVHWSGFKAYQHPEKSRLDFVYLILLFLFVIWNLLVFMYYGGRLVKWSGGILFISTMPAMVLFIISSLDGAKGHYNEKNLNEGKFKDMISLRDKPDLDKIVYAKFLDVNFMENTLKKGSYDVSSWGGIGRTSSTYTYYYNILALKINPANPKEEVLLMLHCEKNCSEILGIRPIQGYIQKYDIKTISSEENSSVFPNNKILEILKEHNLLHGESIYTIDGKALDRETWQEKLFRLRMYLLALLIPFLAVIAIQVLTVERK
jgi:hypothetical protein